MTKKQRRQLCYALVLSIFLVIVGFFGVGVRAFASAGISSIIFLVLLGILITVVPIYFVLRGPVRDASIGAKIFLRTPQKSLWPGDRRGQFKRGQELVAFAVERRGKKAAGISTVGQKSATSENSHG
jgi:hypothetical protein